MPIAVIAPIIFGGGTRIKILEAMAFGRHARRRGLGLESAEHGIPADSMEDFAAGVVELARGPEKRIRLACNARASRCNSGISVDEICATVK